MSVTILHTVNGYLCEFEGEDWEDADPDVGMEPGYCSWNLLTAQDDNGVLDDRSLKEVSDFIVDREDIGDAILVKLNCARMEYDADDGWLDSLGPI